MKKQVEKRVESILNISQDFRDSDKKLLLMFWEREGLFLSEAQKVKFYGCTPAESITRARRALRYQYPASDDVEAQRRKREVEEKFSNSPKAVSWLKD